MKTKPSDPAPGTKKALHPRIAAAQHQADAAKKEAKLAKLTFRAAKQKFKDARRAAKKARKFAKTLEHELAALAVKKPRRKSAPKKPAIQPPAPRKAIVRKKSPPVTAPLISTAPVEVNSTEISVAPIAPTS